MNDYIQNKWQSKELPGINCLLHANGEVLIFNHYVIKDNGVAKTYFFPLCETSISSLEKYNEDIWTAVEPYVARINYGDDIITHGEGCMGNEGYVGLTDKKGNLIWAYFFDFSNPIGEVAITDDILICRSSNEKVISIDLKNLSNVSVT